MYRIEAGICQYQGSVATGGATSGSLHPSRARFQGIYRNRMERRREMSMTNRRGGRVSGLHNTMIRFAVVAIVVIIAVACRTATSDGTNLGGEFACPLCERSGADFGRVDWEEEVGGECQSPREALPVLSGPRSQRQTVDLRRKVQALAWPKAFLRRHFSGPLLARVSDKRQTRPPATVKAPAATASDYGASMANRASNNLIGDLFPVLRAARRSTLFRDGRWKLEAER